jgi:vacuolar-type H+-ATPase subunit C/Vma6
MSQLTKYAYANAKIRAMLSRLLEPKFFESLVSSRSYPEALELLRKTQYSSVVENADPEGCDLDRIEKRFAGFDEAAFRKVSSVLQPAESRFVLLLLEKFEVEALKVALRFWYKKPAQDAARFLPDHAIVHAIDYGKIVRAQSLEELIVLLAETPYFRPLARARDKFKEKGSLFYHRVQSAEEVRV